MAIPQENNLIRLEEVTLRLDEEEGALREKAAKILGLSSSAIIRYIIIKRAVDSREKGNILLVYAIAVEIKHPHQYFSKKNQLTHFTKKKIARHKIRRYEPYVYVIEKLCLSPSLRPIVVGTGPSGLFCALVLAEAGLNPLVIERGADVDGRIKDVDCFFTTGKLDTHSNIQFGEGGAGTFSDGKLYTNIKSSRIKYVFDEFITAGAPQQIATDAHPHIGTDKLRQVIKRVRQKIISLGGQVRFHTCLTDIIVKDGRVVAVVLNDNETMLVDDLVIAVGHSARDTYQMLYDKKVEMKPKTFAVGLRIEHSAHLINQNQYGSCCGHAKLPTARYKLVAHLKERRSVYTFCMCPGGFVVASSSEAGGLVINGMSECAQDGKNSNSALLVNIFPQDFDSDHPLAGIEFQRKWERQAFKLGGSNYHAPAQLVGDFLKCQPSKNIGCVAPTYEPGVCMTSLDPCLPDYVVESIRDALPVFDKKIKGFANSEAVLTGVETRSSAPVRFARDESLQSNITGIYPTGEGAGYAGGIVSSAVDGMKVAESIIQKYY